MGSYVISVSAGTGCYRHIQISQNATLYRLHEAILEAFEFMDDHAHAFFMDNKTWSQYDAYYSMKMDGSERLTKGRKLEKLNLKKGTSLSMCLISARSGASSVRYYGNWKRTRRHLW